jgi:protein-L-isoaspartate(D-aspartate) O-methyltransferase
VDALRIERDGIRNPAVVDAIRRVPRDLFVPRDIRHRAHVDRALPIEHGQTISQPSVVALMTDLARVDPGSKVLEIGTGSGYQAAVLATLGAEVYSVEIIEPLAERARERLARLGYDAVRVRHGDGYEGWPERGPFDAVLVTAAAPSVPEPLLQQVGTGGRLVAPVGKQSHAQDLIVLRRTETGFTYRRSIPVVFVPMTGKADESR